MRSTDIIGYSLSKGGSFSSYASQVASPKEMMGDNDSSESSLVSEKDQIILLEEELAKLRESTKQALHQSWDEVETVNVKLSNREETIAQLGQELELAQFNEKQWQEQCLHWQERCLQSETKLAEQEAVTTNNIECVSDDERRKSLLLKSESRQGSSATSLGSRSSLGSIGTTILGWTTRRNSTNIKPVSLVITAPSNDIIPYNNAFLVEKDMNIRELETKIATRDAVIENLEETLETNALSMHVTQNEMHCLMDRLRIKNYSDNMRERDGKKEKQHTKKQTRAEMNDNIPEFKETIKNLRYEVDERNTRIKLQELKISRLKALIVKKKMELSKSKGYINELSEGLSNALNVIKSRTQEDCK